VAGGGEGESARHGSARRVALHDSLAVEYKVPDRMVIAPTLGLATTGLALSLRF